MRLIQFFILGRDLIPIPASAGKLIMDESGRLCQSEKRFPADAVRGPPAFPGHSPGFFLAILFTFRPDSGMIQISDKERNT